EQAGVGQLNPRWFASELVSERVGPALHAIQLSSAAHGNAHRAAVVGDRLYDRLPDPPDRVRDELDAVRVVELLSGANEAEVAFVDQIGQRNAVVLVALGDRHDEAQIGADESVERLRVAGANAAGELGFLVSREQRVGANLVQVGRQRIAAGQIVVARGGGNRG